MSCGRSCVGGVHVIRMTYLTIYCVLLRDISYWMIFLHKGMYYRRACLVV